MKVFYLLFILSVSLCAKDWVNEFPVYWYGDVGFLGVIFEFIKAVITDPSVKEIIAVGFTIAALISGWQLRLGGADAVNILGKSILAPIAIYAMFFAPFATVRLVDLRVDYGYIDYTLAGPSGGYKVVDDVPYALAALVGSSALLNMLFIDLIDENWAGVATGNKFSSLGFQKMHQINQDMMMIAKLDTASIDVNATTDMLEMAYNSRQYIKHCLIDKATGLNSANAQLLYTPKKAFPDMFAPTEFLTSDGTATGNKLADEKVTFDDGVAFNRAVVVDSTCGSLYTTYIAGIESGLATQMVGLIKAKHPTVDPASASFNEAFREQTGLGTGTIIGTISKAASTLAMSRAMEGEISKVGIGVNGTDVAIGISIEQSLGKLRTEGLAKFEWMSRMLPKALSIVLGVVLAAFPLFVIVISFFGANAWMAVGNYFKGYIALNFNLVSLALVSNIISYFTAQNAQQAISTYAGMPYGLEHVSAFMMDQADMAGLAGLIGTASVFAVTPLIFTGETKGFNAALGAINGAFSGNVDKTAQETLKDADLNRTIDEQAVSSLNGANDAEARTWLDGNGYTPGNLGAVEQMNNILRGNQQIGSAMAASEILHSENMENFRAGTQAQSSQSYNKTAGFGAKADMASVQSVSFEDGEVQGNTINSSARLREEGGYNTEDIGTGMAMQQYSKDMGMAHMGQGTNATWANNDAAQSALDNVAQSVNDKAALSNMRATGASNDVASDLAERSNLMAKNDELADTMMSAQNALNNKDLSMSDDRADELQDVIDFAKQGMSENDARLGEINSGIGQKFDNEIASKEQAGADAQSAEMSQAIADGFEGAKTDDVSALVANATNQAMTQIASGKGLLTSGAFNEDGTVNTGSEVAGKIIEATAAQSAGKVASLVGMSDAMHKGGEKNGFDDYVAGQEMGGRVDANKSIGKGEEWQKTGDKADLMKDVKGNEVVGTFGGIKSTAAGIEAQDGVANAIKIQEVSGALRGSTDKDVLDSQLKEAGSKDGLKDSVTEIADAIKTLASTAGTMAGAKTASDITSIGSFDSASDFIDAQSRDALDKSIQSKVRSDVSTNQDIKDNVIANEKEAMKRLGGDHLQKYIEDGKKMGFLDKDGNAIENADKWVAGRSTLNASGMNKNEQGFVGGARITSAYNATTGEGITDADAVKTTKDGYSTTANLYNPEDMSQARAREKAEHALDWKKSAAKIMSSGGDKASEFNKYLNDNGFNTHLTDEEARAGGDTAMYAATGALAGMTLNQMPKALGGKRSIIDMIGGFNKSRDFSDSNPVSETQYQANSDKTTKSDNPDHSNSLNNSDNPSIAENINNPENIAEKNKHYNLRQQKKAQSQHINAFEAAKKQIQTDNPFGLNHLDNLGTPNTVLDMPKTMPKGFHTPKVMGTGKAALATTALMVATGAMANGNIDIPSAVNTAFNQNPNASIPKNTINAVDAAANFVDPTFAGYSTLKQTGSNIYANVSAGNYSAAAGNILSTPKNFATNVVNDGYNMGQALHKIYDNHTQQSSVVMSATPQDFKQSVDTVRQADMQAQTGDAIIDSIADLTKSISETKE